MSFEVKIYRLGEIADVQTGPFGSQLHKDDYVSHGTPIITVEHLGENIIFHENTPKVSDEDAIRLSKYSLQEGDIVFSRVGSVDRRAYVSEKEHGWLFSGRCLRVRVNKRNNIDPRYLSYYFGLESFKEYVRSIAVGATMPSLNTKIMSGLEIEAPELNVQIAIAKILMSLDEKIHLNNAINKNLEEIAQALFKRWFVDFEFPNENGEPYKSSGGEFEESELGLIPKGWKVGRATDIFDVQSGGTPKTSTSEYWNGEIPFFTPKDCSNSLYVIETEKTITEDGLNNCNSKLFKTDTVFITARGTVGKVALAGRDMAMNQSCYALVAKSGYTQKYVFHLTQQLVNVLRKNASGAVFDAITVSTFQNLKTTLPDIELVRHFDGLVNGLYSLLLEKANETQTLQQLRDTLLPKLMSGEIRVPVERDNSATELPMVAESSAIYQP
ncbi:restriction endonuclease subunit S [Paenibacillus sp. DYY-L-2]|uniref:restriction endonuclease subunit S n=1 Tax=Paenibacillus sp. DYY-L-2 TaxID=3447013 RepID=UPI003F50594C